MFKKKVQNDNRFYKLDLKETAKKRINRRNWLYFMGMFFFWLLAGLVNQDSSRTVYVLFPYYFIFLPIIYFGYGALNFNGLSNIVDGIAYDGSVRRMQRSGLGIIIWTSINILLDIIYIIRNFKITNLTKEILYCLPLIGIIIVGIAFAKFYDENYAKLTMQNL